MAKAIGGFLANQENLPNSVKNTLLRYETYFSTEKQEYDAIEQNIAEEEKTDKIENKIREKNSLPLIIKQIKNSDKYKEASETEKPAVFEGKLAKYKRLQGGNFPAPCSNADWLKNLLENREKEEQLVIIFYLKNGLFYFAKEEAATVILEISEDEDIRKALFNKFASGNIVIDTSCIGFVEFLLGSAVNENNLFGYYAAYIPKLEKGAYDPEVDLGTNLEQILEYACENKKAIESYKPEFVSKKQRQDRATFLKFFLEFFCPYLSFFNWSAGAVFTILYTSFWIVGLISFFTIVLICLAEIFSERACEIMKRPIKTMTKLMLKNKVTTTITFVLLFILSAIYVLWYFTSSFWSVQMFTFLLAGPMIFSLALTACYFVMQAYYLVKFIAEKIENVRDFNRGMIAQQNYQPGINEVLADYYQGINIPHVEELNEHDNYGDLLF